jgi:hypothetical protein
MICFAVTVACRIQVNGTATSINAASLIVLSAMHQEAAAGTPEVVKQDNPLNNGDRCNILTAFTSVPNNIYPTNR